MARTRELGRAPPTRTSTKELGNGLRPDVWEPEGETPSGRPTRPGPVTRKNFANVSCSRADSCSRSNASNFSVTKLLAVHRGFVRALRTQCVLLITLILLPPLSPGCRTQPALPR